MSGPPLASASLDLFSQSQTLTIWSLSSAQLAKYFPHGENASAVTASELFAYLNS